MKRIRITDEFEVRCTDSLNWVPYEYRKTVDKNGRESMRWVSLYRYFSAPSGAVEWIAKELIARGQNDAILGVQTALEGMRAVAAEISAAAARFDAEGESNGNA